MNAVNTLDGVETVAWSGYRWRVSARSRGLARLVRIRSGGGELEAPGDVVWVREEQLG